MTNNRDEPFGEAAAISPKDGGYWKVPVVSLDAEVGRLKLPPPYLMKLDTHGFEREIIEGARETLGQTNLFINEFCNCQSESTDDRKWSIFLSSAMSGPNFFATNLKSIRDRDLFVAKSG